MDLQDVWDVGVVPTGKWEGIFVVTGVEYVGIVGPGSWTRRGESGSIGGPGKWLQR